MTPEAQRIAIAEACGWKRAFENPGWRWCRDGEFASLPDYPNDLNAMHEAEARLTDEQQPLYFDWLSITSGARIGESPLYAFTIATSTAAQRAEAFLKTLGLWQD